MENLVTVLAYNPTGKIVANMLDTNLLEGDYRVIAERCIDYWHQYKEQPGEHTPDLMADILEDKHNRRTKSVSRILRNMIAIADGVNTDYIMTQLRLFSRMQRLKSAIIESAEKINANAEIAIPEIEEIWHQMLRAEQQDFDPGMTLLDYDRVLAKLEQKATEFSMGVKQLDERGVVPMRGTMTVLLAAAGRGKTWGLVHVGKHALLRRKKVLHISLEMDEEDIGLRYYMSIFTVPKHDGDVVLTTMTIDDDNKLDALNREVFEPAFTFEKAVIRDELINHAEHFGARFANLRIKRFAPGSLTVSGLIAFLDMLEQTEGFIPDLLNLDYLGIMKVDPKNLRASLGHVVMELRGVAVARNIALVTAHQASKAGEEAAMVKATHVAEDWSIIGTADTVVTYSCTEREFRYGLARLFVAKARGEEDRFALVITQSYRIGQWCLDSYFLDKGYRNQLEDFTKDDADTDDAEDDDDD
jgi:replicative DNA helicase